MKLAFLISAHNDPTQLKRLIGSLPQNSVFIVHIDAKANLQSFTSIIDDSRVYFIENRTNVMWGSIGVVEAQMKTIRKALDLHYREPLDYFVLLTGLDYPLWSNDKINEFFASNKGKEYIVTLCMDNQGEAAQLYREHRPFNYKYWPYSSLGSKFRVALRHLIYGIGIRKSLFFTAKGREYVLYKGAMNWAITPNLAALALDYWTYVPYDNNASERGVRKIKIKQKVSGCFRTDGGADDFAKLHSIAETAMKNGNSKFSAILAVVQQ